MSWWMQVLIAVAVCVVLACLWMMSLAYAFGEALGVAIGMAKRGSDNGDGAGGK